MGYFYFNKIWFKKRIVEMGFGIQKKIQKTCCKMSTTSTPFNVSSFLLLRFYTRIDWTFLMLNFTVQNSNERSSFIHYRQSKNDDEPSFSNLHFNQSFRELQIRIRNNKFPYFLGTQRWLCKLISYLRDNNHKETINPFIQLIHLFIVGYTKKEPTSWTSFFHLEFLQKPNVPDGNERAMIQNLKLVSYTKNKE